MEPFLIFSIFLFNLSNFALSSERDSFNSLLETSCNEIESGRCTKAQISEINRSLATSCQLLKAARGCNQLEKALQNYESHFVPSHELTPVHEKILSCDTKKLCKREGKFTGCALAALGSLSDILYSLITLPQTIPNFVIKAFESDKACFENKDSIKETLINTYDYSIPDRFKEHRVPKEIKRKMITDWPCQEIRSYLYTKNKKYQSAIAPLVASGEIKSVMSESPIQLAIKNLISSTKERWDCYTEKAQYEMICYAATSVILPSALIGPSFFKIKSKYPEITNRDTSKTFIIKKEKELEHLRPPPPSAKTINENPQAAIWQLRDAGMIEDATVLENSLIGRLTELKIAKDEQVGKGIMGARYITLEDGTVGLWKPDQYRVYADLIGIGDNEVAAFLIDRKLGINQVPVTVRRDIDGVKGSIQLVVKGLDDFKFRHAPETFSFLDELIANRDRHNGNLLSTNGRPVAIDNGLSFRITEERPLRDSLLNAIFKFEMAQTNEQRVLAIAEAKYVMPSKEVVDRLKKITVNEWQQILTTQLGKDKVDFFLNRREETLKIITEAESKLGKEVYPDALYSPDMKKR